MKVRSLLVIVILCCFSPALLALDMRNKFSVYGSIADEYNYSAIRLGYNNWEAGIITGSGIFSFGLIKNFMVGRYSYAGFGFGVINGDHSTSPAYGSLIGAIGLEYPVLSWFALRGEMVATGQWQGMGYGGIMLGVRAHTF